MAIDRRTLKLLWGRAGNRCSFPDCRSELSVPGDHSDTDAVIGEICHIIAGRKGGPRGTSQMSLADRDKVGNLILLCPTHHSLVDAQKRRFTPAALRKMKAEHELWVRRTLSTWKSHSTPLRAPRLGPPLPSDYVRTEHFRAAKKEILRAPAILTFVGGPGVGKSSLAAALCHDAAVRAAYPDGSLWITLGSELLDLTPTLVDFIEVLSGTRPGFHGPAAAAAHLRTLVGDRRMLVILDDVWEAFQIEPFLDGYTACCRIVTTRNSSLTPATSRCFRISAMRYTQATQLVANGLPTPGISDERSLLSLAQRLGGWPFLLKLANSALRQRVHDANQLLSDALMDLAAAFDAAGVTAIDKVPAFERNQSVAQTLHVSIDRLLPSERARLAELSIFPEDIAIPLSEIGALWNSTAGLDPTRTIELCLRLYDRSLVTNLDLAARTLTLHDLVRKYLRDIHRNDLGHWNLQFANAMGDWRHFTIAVRYRWQQLAYHLSQAGEEVRLRDLLCDGHWLRAKLEAIGINGVITDFSYVPGEDLASIRDALRLSTEALAADTAQLASQLYGRLLDLEDGIFRRVLHTVASATPEPWLRPTLPRLTSPRSPLVLNLSTGFAQFGRENMTALAISDDARLAASGSSNGMVRLWNLQEPASPTTFTTKAGWVRAVALDSNSRYVSAVSSGTQSSCDKRTILQTWDIATQRLVARCAWPTGTKGSPAATIPDRALVDMGGSSRAGVVVIGQRSWELPTDWSVSAAAVTSDATHAAVADLNSSKTRFFDVTHQKQYSSIRAGQWISALAVTNDFKTLLAGYFNGTLKIWDTESRKKIRTIEGHIGAVQAAAITPDGRYAVAASNAGTFALWDLRRGDFRRDPSDHREAITELACNVSGTLVLSGDYDGYLKAWNAETGELLHSVRAHREQVTALKLCRQDTLAVSCSRDGSIIVRDTETFKTRYSIKTDDIGACDVAILEDRYVVCGMWYGIVAVLDLATGESGSARGENPTTIVRVLPTGRNGEVVLAFEIGPPQLFNVFTATFGDTVSGRLFASILNGHKIISYVWKKDIVTLHDEVENRQICSLRCGNDWFADLLVDDSLAFAFSCGRGRNLRVWDLRAAKCHASYIADTSLLCCAISKNMRRIAAGDAAGRVHFLELVEASHSCR